jgi:DNA-binding IclR family transcriptional regulator
VSEPEGVAAVDRALCILEAFHGSGDDLSLGDIAERTGLYKSTILRMLATLERHRFVVRLEKATYRLGPALYRLGARYKASFRLEDHLLPTMRDLANITNDSVTFYTREGDLRLCLFRIDSTQAVRENHTQVGDLAPLTRGPVGRAFVVFADGSRRARSEDFRDLPFLDLGVVYPDVSAAAAPVFGVDGALVGVLAVSGPKARFTRPRVGVICKALMRAVSEISVVLGADPSEFTAKSPRSERWNPRTAS